MNHEPEREREEATSGKKDDRQRDDGAELKLPRTPEASHPDTLTRCPESRETEGVSGKGVAREWPKQHQRRGRCLAGSRKEKNRATSIRPKTLDPTLTRISPLAQ